MKKIFTFFAAALTISAYAAQPTTAPVAPTQAPENVKALFCSAYDDLEFEPTSWGTTWEAIEVQGTSMLYTESMGWDCVTNWGAEEYNFSDYTHFCIDMYVEEAGEITLTFESNQNLDPKVGYQVNLAAGWNKFDLVLKECYPGVTFQHIKYLVVEAFSHEGTEFTMANAYFYKEGETALENTTATVKAQKVIENGQIVIIKNGVRYNAVGAML